MSLTIHERLKNIEASLGQPENILGKGLMQPFSNTNSASRKLMFSTQLEQIMPLMNPEPALVDTGYENEFGRHASSYVEAPDDFVVINKIPKFSHDPERFYYLVVQSKEGVIDVIKRTEYCHITESYGYLYNNTYLDKLKIGSTIKKGEVVQKSTSFDNYNNRQDGVNAIVAYMTPHNTTDDGFIVSDVAAVEYFSSPFIDTIPVNINDNDVPLNLYGDYERYKCCPDIGEEIKDGILLAYRRTKNEEMLHTQSYDRLREIFTSDEKIVGSGTVIDINIYCNNRENFKNNFYNAQLEFYHEQSLSFSKRIIEALQPLVDNKSLKRSYELEKLYLLHKKIYDGKLWEKDGKDFSNIIVEFVILKVEPLKEGDKLSDRYGGKGVVSRIVPESEMPLLDNGKRAHIIANTFSVPGRKNPGQLFECSLTCYSNRLLEYFDNYTHHLDECVEMYLNYMMLVSPKSFQYFNNLLKNTNDYEKLSFFDILGKYGGIHVSLDPISESMSIDKLDRIRKTFPWIEPYKIMVPVKDSMGKIRNVEARRALWVGSKYMYRLKQYAEDKFSATSLSATNIKNEPTKSKAAKNYKSPYSKTPIRFGEMETGDMYHLNVETVVKNLMLHSTSPHARRLAEKLFYENPFNVNIELNEDSSNRNVEILNAYLKTIGLRLKFTKIPRKLIKPISFSTIGFDNKMVNPISFGDEMVQPKIYNHVSKDGKIQPIRISPITFY